MAQCSLSLLYFFITPVRSHAAKQLLVLNITTIEQASYHFRLRLSPELKYLVNLFVKLAPHNSSFPFLG